MRASKEEKCAKKAREYIGNRLGLVEGKVYTLIFRQQAERSERHTVIKKRMHFLKAFRITHFLKTLTGSKDRLPGGKWKNY